MKKAISRISKPLSLLWLSMLLVEFGLAQEPMQDYGIQRISTEILRSESGISQSSIRCIFQDHKGLLWFGTWDGLNRYDGIRFIVLRAEVGDNMASLLNSTVNVIAQDNQHQLWVGTDGGINCIDYQHLKRIDLKLHQATNIAKDTIHAICIDHQNRIWLGSQKGLGVINETRDSLLRFSEIFGQASVLDHIEIRQILQINPNNWWIGTAEGLFLVDLVHKKIIRWNQLQLSDPHITSLSHYRDSLLFVGTENGLNIIQLSNIHEAHQAKYVALNASEKYNTILSSLLLDDSSLLVGSVQHGLMLYNFKKSVIQAFSLPNLGEMNTDGFIASEENIMSIFKDQYNNIWLGTAWNGFLRISPEPILFRTFRKTPNRSKGLNDNHIWGFLYDKDEIWVATESGINLYNLSNHSISYLNTKNGLVSNKVRAMYKDSRGFYWIGSNGEGLSLIHPNGKIVNYKAQDLHSIISNNTIWGITESPDGFIWISTYDGLVKINPATMQSQVFRYNPSDPKSLSSNTVYNSYFDQKGNLWVSTYHGLNLMPKGASSFKRYLHIENDSNSLSTNRIFKVYHDNEDQLWIATIGGGLNCLNLKTGNIQWFTTSHGLPNNVIYSLIDDGMGFLWLSTNNGICRFNKKSHIVNTYSAADGLQSNEFNFGAELLDPNLNIYFGGMNGFNVFNPRDIQERSQYAPLSISWLKSLQSGKYYDLDFGDTIVLLPQSNFFEIAYSQLNFKFSDKAIFRHRLVPFDQDWIVERAGVAEAAYSNLPAGNYKFQVQMALANGSWSNSTYELVIIVKQYWYKQNWFIGLSALIILLLINFGIYLWYKRLKHNAHITLQIHQLEKQALRLQMNPHFFFNTLNSIQSYILNNKTEESIAYLSKFSKLMRSILNNSSESIVTLRTEIEMLNQYLILEQLRFDHQFDFSIRGNEAIDTEFVGIPGMLLQPFVENAIIHGVAPLKDRKGFITITFQMQNNRLRCIIEDNGVGRAFHQNKNHEFNVPKGMMITQRRLQLLNKTKENETPILVEDITDSKTKICGTRITLNITIENLMD